MNYKREEQLGMSSGKAAAILRKSVMFSLVKQCNLDNCYQCGKKIDNIDDFSIEHKVPWLDSENPLELFFDLNNIAFSHLKCNANASRREYRVISGRLLAKTRLIHPPEGFNWCGHCKQFLPLDNFYKCSASARGLERECKECKRRYTR